MKRIVLTAAVLLICLTILLPVVGSGNHSIIIPASDPTLYQTDGWPMPPPIGPHSQLSNGLSTDSLLVADGWPMPPPIGPHQSDSLLVA